MWGQWCPLKWWHLIPERIGPPPQQTRYLYKQTQYHIDMWLQQKHHSCLVQHLPGLVSDGRKSTEAFFSPVTLILTSKQWSWVTGTVDLLVTTPLFTVFGMTVPRAPESVLLKLDPLCLDLEPLDRFSSGICKKSRTSWSQSKMRKTLRLLRSTVKQEDSRVDLQENVGPDQSFCEFVWKLFKPFELWLVTDNATRAAGKLGWFPFWKAGGCSQTHWGETHQFFCLAHCSECHWPAGSETPGWPTLIHWRSFQKATLTLQSQTFERKRKNKQAKSF